MSRGRRCAYRAYDDIMCADLCLSIVRSGVRSTKRKRKERRERAKECRPKRSTEGQGAEKRLRSRSLCAWCR
eukprot:357126-Pleurochrysis_carterae.AAC.2